MDLFSSVDVFFFNLSIFQKFFILMTFSWLLYSFFFSFFLKKNMIFFINHFFVKMFNSQLEDTKGFSLKNWFKVIWCFFFFIVFSKLLGLLPYIYGLTTNFFVVFFLSLWGWSIIVFSSMFVNPYLFFGHFCPQGAPTVLGWFLSLVEVISVVIRSGTLTLRLVAKMTTGHILIGLLTITCCGLMLNLSMISATFVLLILNGYLIFEFFICMIQGNVFSMLLLNYTSEHL